MDRVPGRPHSLFSLGFRGRFLQGVVYGFHEKCSGGGARVLTLILSITVMLGIALISPHSGNAADSEFTGLSAGCATQLDDEDNLRPSCTVSVHRVSGPDLTATYEYKYGKMTLSGDAANAVVVGPAGYETAYAPYGTQANAVSNGVITSLSYVPFGLKNPPTRPTAQTTVAQMPTTGAPTGLSDAGLLAVAVGLAGVTIALKRRHGTI